MMFTVSNVSGDWNRIAGDGPDAVMETLSTVGGRRVTVKVPLRSIVPNVPNVAEASESV